LEEACKFLVELANLRGGPDNITVVVLKMLGEASTDTEEPPPVTQFKPKASLLKHLPWSGVAFGSGITLALVALIMKLTLDHVPGGLILLTFVLAIGMLVAGFVGWHRTKQEPADEESDEEAGPPQVHRRASCRIDDALLHKMMQAEANLQEEAREKGWSIPWAKHGKHIQAAATLLGKDDMVAAFREEIRAIALLALAVRHNRDKGEAFRPNW
jgi:protein phosphatase